MSSLIGIAAIQPFRPEILVVPDVLANRDAQLVSVELERRDVFGRFKIAVFVKNVVSRQQAFVRAPDDFPVLQDGGGIAERASGTVGVLVHITDAKRNFANAFGRFRQGGEIGVNEIRAQQQIARRVAAQKQFRREDEFRAARAGLFITGQSFCRLAAKSPMVELSWSRPIFNAVRIIGVYRFAIICWRQKGWRRGVLFVISK